MLIASSRVALTRVVLALGALASAASAQTTWFVDAGAVPPGNGSLGSPYTSIQFAIDQAATADGDTLEVAAGTYNELVNLHGKTLSLKAPSGPAATIIDTAGLFVPDRTCLTMDSGEGAASLVEGFTIQNGFGTFDGTFGTEVGGGVYLEGTSPTFRDCVLTDNEASIGAGLFSRGGSPRFEDVEFTGNGTFSTLLGGGAYIEGGAGELDGCRFLDSTAQSFGGGLYASGADLSIDGCEFVDGFCSSDGAGAYINGGTVGIDESLFELNLGTDGNGPGMTITGGADVTVTGGVVRDNTSDNDHTGGGISVESGAKLTFLDGEVRGNFSARGGGIASAGTLRVERSMIVDNIADSAMALDGNGGGVWVSPLSTGTAVLLDTVVAGNLASPGAGGGGEGGGVFGPALLENCTIFGNTAALAGGSQGASLLNAIHRGNTPVAPGLAPSVTYSNVEGGALGVGNIDLDPLFWDPMGPDFHLLAGSPCIDAGDPISPLDPDGSRADMGAFPFEGGYARSYCTAGTSAIGCSVLVSSSGLPSATASSGFVLSGAGAEGQRNGLFFFGTSGRQANSWGNGTSFQCVVPPVKRGQVLSSGGTPGACDGVLAFDLNARWCPTCPRPGQNPGAGAIVQAQAWYRDPASTSNQSTSLSDAIEFQVQP